MKIVKGSFGTSGKASIKSDTLLVGKFSYNKDDISSINAEVIKESHFGTVGFVFGAAILGIIGFFILAILGAVIGVVLAFVGSKYSTSEHVVALTFNDSKTVTLSGSKSEIADVVRFTNA
jgi:hypothetical protein